MCDKFKNPKVIVTITDSIAPTRERTVPQIDKPIVMFYDEEQLRRLAQSEKEFMDENLQNAISKFCNEELKRDLKIIENNSN